MGLVFRLTECVLLLVVILCVITNNTASKQLKKKQKFQSLKRILPFLQKKERPKFHNRYMDWNFTNEISAARYMLDLYKSLETTDNEDNSQTFNVTNVATTKQVQGADTIMGILNDATDKPKSSSSHMRLKFNFTAKIQTGDSVEAAEFRIYKSDPVNDWMINATFLVELFAITVPGNQRSKLRNKLGQRQMQGKSTGWEVFDVTATVDMWIVSPKNNYGLEISVRFRGSQVPYLINPSQLGFIDFKGPYAQRPFIVSFFKGDPTEKEVVIHASSRGKRSLQFKPGNLKYGSTSSSTECRKRHLYVDFHELRWQNWIIAPDGYESSYCAGECNYGMYRSRNATNHAIVQTLVNLLNPDSAPAPCCAPTKLNAISVLYYDEKQNVVLKKFQDMVVKSCGCH